MSTLPDSQDTVDEPMKIILATLLLTIQRDINGADEYVDFAIKEIEALLQVREREAFNAGVAMSGGDLDFQEAFYKQWKLNLEEGKSQ